jgi:hypothetical protein
MQTLIMPESAVDADHRASIAYYAATALRPNHYSRPDSVLARHSSPYFDYSAWASQCVPANSTS